MLLEALCVKGLVTALRKEYALIAVAFLVLLPGPVDVSSTASEIANIQF